jgi:nicotinamide mononucleotide (NMN) deamidase PncC
LCSKINREVPSAAISVSLAAAYTPQGDAEEYHAGGAWFEAHKANHPSAESVPFLNVNHGFVSRGDPNDAEVQEAATSAIEHTFRFIAAHMK